MPDDSILTAFGNPQGLTGEQVNQSYWSDGNVFGDFFGHKDSFAHNEAIAAYNRELAGAKEMFELESNFNALEAQKNRDFEKMMSDTSFQRKVADLKAAGFSPLAALDGATGAPMASGSAASASGKAPSAAPAKNGSNPLGGLIGSIIMAAAMIAGKGIDAASKAAGSSAAAAAQASRDNALSKQKLENAMALERYKKGLDSVAYRKPGESFEAPRLSRQDIEALSKIARYRWVPDD